MNPIFHRIKSVLRPYRRSTAMLIVIVSILCFILGFSVAQLATRPIGVEIVSPIISTIASLGGFFAVFREYFKDRRDERKTPVLKNEKIPIKKLQHFSTGVQTNYFLRILKTSGQGIANECHGFIDMKDYRHKMTIWDDFENSQYAKISIFEDLLLFGILQNEMRFCSNFRFAEDGSKVGTYAEKSYNDYANEQMSVNIGAANAKVPEPFIMKVKDIVDNAILKQ
jgi:hypothetical protein